MKHRFTHHGNPVTPIWSTSRRVAGGTAIDCYTTHPCGGIYTFTANERNITMDPDACLTRIADAESDEEISEACTDLYNWIKFGGFQPNWKAQPEATTKYRARLKKGDIW